MILCRLCHERLRTCSRDLAVSGVLKDISLKRKKKECRSKLVFLSDGICDITNVSELTPVHARIAGRLSVEAIPVLELGKVLFGPDREPSKDADVH